MKLYTIKPLVWMDVPPEVAINGAANIAECPPWVLIVGEQNGSWHFDILLHDGKFEGASPTIRSGEGYESKEAARLAAEAACVKLLEEALEEHR